MKVLKYQKVERDGIAKYLYITKDWVFLAHTSSVWTDLTAPNIHHLELRKHRWRSDSFHVVVFRSGIGNLKSNNKSNTYQQTSGSIHSVVKYSRKTDEADTILMEVLL